LPSGKAEPAPARVAQTARVVVAAFSAHHRARAVGRRLRARHGGRAGPRRGAAAATAAHRGPIGAVEPAGAAAGPLGFFGRTRGAFPAAPDAAAASAAIGAERVFGSIIPTALSAGRQLCRTVRIDRRAHPLELLLQDLRALTLGMIVAAIEPHVRGVAG